jgi:hypothetical protein
LLALKNNQQSLFEDAECAFKMMECMIETLDADHGRIETRKCRFAENPLPDRKQDETSSFHLNGIAVTSFLLR